MKIKNNFVIPLFLVGIAILFSGCAKKETIYYWDDYQANLYNYYQQDKISLEEQMASLELIVEKAQSANKPVPPGLHAHLGLLYASLGAQDKAFEQFEIEKTRYPESAQFIQFIQNKYQGTTK